MEMTDDLDDGWERAEAAELTQSVIDDLTSANAALRARVAELEQKLNTALSAMLDSDKRAASLQAEVETLHRERDARNVEVMRLTEALAESERKRADMVKRHVAAYELARSLKPAGHDGDEESGAHDEDCGACAWEALMAALGE